MPLKTIELTQTASLHGPRNKWKSIAISALTYFIGLLICSGLLLLDLLSRFCYSGLHNKCENTVGGERKRMFDKVGKE